MGLISYCNENTRSRWLLNGRKFCYMGHRRFLPMSHRFREDKVSFDGFEEWEYAPPKLSRTDVKKQLDCVLTDYKKEDIIKRKNGEKMVRLPGKLEEKKVYSLNYYTRSII